MLEKIKSVGLYISGIAVLVLSYFLSRKSLENQELSTKLDSAKAENEVANEASKANEADRNYKSARDKYNDWKRRSGL